MTAAMMAGLAMTPTLVGAAISNEVGFSGGDRVAGFDSFSKSFVVNQTGYGNMNIITVPNGEVWELQSLRVTNCSDQAQRVSGKVTDQDGFTYIALPEVGPIEVPAGGVYSWQGSLMIPAGWRVYAEWFDLDGSGCKNNAQTTALVLQTSSN